MIKVEVANRKNLRLFGANFETMDLTQEWIDEQVLIDSWGKKERWTVKKNQDFSMFDGVLDIVPIIIDYDISDVVEEETRLYRNAWEQPVYQLDENGEIVMETVLVEDPITGEIVDIEQPVVESTIFHPQIDIIWVKLKKEYDIVITDLSQDREVKMVEIRRQRDVLLKEADIEIYKLEDISADASAWRAYRQELRDFPAQYIEVDNQPSLEDLDLVDIAAIPFPAKP